MPSTFREVPGARAAVRITPINQTTHAVSGASVFYTIQKAKIHSTVGTGDTTNFESSQFHEDVATIYSADIELVQASYDPTLNLFATSITLFAGTKVCIDIFPDFIGNPANFWGFSVVRITDVDHDIDALNLQPITLKGKTIGTYSSAI